MVLVPRDPRSWALYERDFDLGLMDVLRGLLMKPTQKKEKLFIIWGGRQVKQQELLNRFWQTSIAAINARHGGCVVSLNIAIVTIGVYPMKVGGAEIHTRYHAIGLAKRGHKVVVFTVGKNRASLILAPGVTAKTIGVEFPLLRQILMILGTFAELVRRRNQIDIIHVHYATYFAMPAYLMSLFFSKPYVVTCHGYDVSILKAKRLWRNLQGAIFRRASATTVTSNYSKDVLQRHYHLEPSIVQVIHNGVDLDEMRNAAVDVMKIAGKVVYLSNLRPVKDPMTAVRAFEKAADFIPWARLVIVGDGPLRDQVAKYLQKTGLRAEVRGSLPHEEAIRELASARVLLHTSLAEGGNPLAVMEAMSVETTVLATEVGGVKDVIVNNVNGILVAPRNVPQIAKNLIRLLTDDTFAEGLATNARRESEACTWTRVADSYEQIYKRILAGHYSCER